MWTILAVAAAVLVVAVTFWTRSKRPAAALPPGPKPTPIFGNLIDLMRATRQGEAPFVTLCKWAFQYGNKGLSSMRFANRQVVVVSDAKTAHQMCVKMADYFSCRPPSLFVSRVLRGKGIVCNDGLSWKAHRNFVQQEFRKFGFSRQSIENPIQHVADELVNQLVKFEGQPHDPHMELATATYNIIWNVISGTTFQWDDPFLGKLIRNLETNLDAMELVGAHNYALILTLVQLIRHNPLRLLLLFVERLRYFKKLISNQKCQGLEPTDGSMIGDYLQQMEHPVGDRELSSQLSETQLLFLISDLFIAGGETTITTLRWIVLCLAIYTPYQDRIRREIMDNVGRDGTPSYVNRSQFPQLEAFIHEVLRFCVVIPGMWRNTSQDCQVGEYDIPKDSWILLHFMAMNKNESTWPEANRFNPDRFLNDQGQFQKNEYFLAFSAGRRQCPGESLARTEVFLLVANLVQKYRIRLAEGYDWTSPPQGKIGVTLYPPKFHVLFTRVESKTDDKAS